MENIKEQEYSDVLKNIANELLIRFNLNDKSKSNILSTKTNSNNKEIFEIQKYYLNHIFTKIDMDICDYLLTLKDTSFRSNNVLLFINFCNVLNTIYDHYYYFMKNPNGNRNFRNDAFDNYIISRGEYEEVFTIYFNENKARELKIDKKGYFNFIPLKCPLAHREETDVRENCFYAHNETELNFHPFVYKKFPCLSNCDLDDCPFYHENYEKMSTEINFQDESIQELIKMLQVKEEEFNKYQSYRNLLYLNDKSKQLATEFNPNTYKTFPCPLGNLCKLNNKLCLNYHNKNDRRRIYDIIKYAPTKCEEYFKTGSCKNGDNCLFAHNLFESLYHPDKFRTKRCTNEICEGGQVLSPCKFKLICPFKHLGDEEKKDEKDGNYHFIGNSRILNGYYLMQLDGHKKQQVNKKKDLKQKLKAFDCPECNNINFLKDLSTTTKGSNFYIVKDDKNNGKNPKIICANCANKSNKDGNLKYPENNRINIPIRRNDLL